VKRQAFSVGDWLALGLGAAAAVLVVVAGAALVGLRGIDEELRRELEVVEPRADGAVDLQISVLRLGLAARAQALAPTEARRQAVEDAERAVETGLSALTAHPDEPGDEEAFSPIPGLVAAYRERAHALSLAPPEEVPAAEARLRMEREALLPRLDAYAELQRRQLFASATEVVHRREQAGVLLVAGVALALLLLAVVAVVVGRKIRGPILELVGLTRSVAAGDYTSAAALPVPAVAQGERPRSELLELAGAFGAMARALREREQRIAAQNEELQARNEELGAQNDALRASEDALREADRRKDEFLAVLSHELRNPLAPIVNGLAIMARAEPGGAQAERAREVVARQVRQLVRLVDDLLDVTRIARGKAELRRVDADLAAIVRHVAEDHRALLDRAEVRLELTLPAQPVPAWIDPERFAQVVANLLQNAAKFTPAGGTVGVAAEVDGGRAVVRIRDDGEGIPPDLLARLFVPFVQAEASLARTRGGLGLGLALVKGIVELHGGTVAVASGGPGCGAEFTVELPLDARRAPVRAPAAEVDAAS
jgi:signal transduction histidine kinase